MTTTLRLRLNTFVKNSKYYIELKHHTSSNKDIILSLHRGYQILLDFAKLCLSNTHFLWNVGSVLRLDE